MQEVDFKSWQIVIVLLQITHGRWAWGKEGYCDFIVTTWQSCGGLKIGRSAVRFGIRVGLHYQSVKDVHKVKNSALWVDKNTMTLLGLVICAKKNFLIFLIVV